MLHAHRHRSIPHFKIHTIQFTKIIKVIKKLSESHLSSIHQFFFQVTNTFQCVVAVRGAITFVFFLYEDLQWTTHNPNNSHTMHARVSLRIQLFCGYY